MLAQAEGLKVELQEELDRSSRSQVLIQFEKNNNWPLRQAQIYAMLEGVPVVWQETSVREKGIFSPNVARYGASNLFSHDDIFGDSEPLVGLEKLKKNISYFRKYISDLDQLPNIHNYTLNTSEIDQLIKANAEQPQVHAHLAAVDQQLRSNNLSLGSPTSWRS